MQANPCGLRGGAARETRIHAAGKSAQRNRTKSWSFLSDLKVRPPKQRGNRERSKLDYMLRMTQRKGRCFTASLIRGAPFGFAQGRKAPRFQHSDVAGSGYYLSFRPKARPQNGKADPSPPSAGGAAGFGMTTCVSVLHIGLAAAGRIDLSRRHAADETAQRNALRAIVFSRESLRLRSGQEIPALPPELFTLTQPSPASC